MLAILEPLRPYLLAIKIAAGVLLLAGAWWHGHSTAAAACAHEAQQARVDELQGLVKEQARIAETLGQATIAAHAREAEALAKVAEVEQRARRRDAAWRTEREATPACDAWMRAPVPCRLRDAPGGGAGGPAGDGAAPGSLPQPRGVGP